MTIRYQNGDAVEAITLFQTEDTLRAAVPGTNDLLELKQLNGTWVTSDCEPVTLEFETRRRPEPAFSDDNFICPAELAARLVNLLYEEAPSGASDPFLEQGEPPAYARLA